jgi:hypothetical protein
MKLKPQPNQSLRKSGAFTLVETLMSLTILAVVFGSSILCYIQACRRAEWSGYSLAAQALCVRQMEQFRAAIWDTQSVPIVDQTTNIPSPVVTILELPITGTNAVWATNTATVTAMTVSGTAAQFKMLTVTTAWPWNGKTFTNSLVAYRCPDQ